MLSVLGVPEAYSKTRLKTARHAHAGKPKGKKAGSRKKGSPHRQAKSGNKGGARHARAGSARSARHAGRAAKVTCRVRPGDTLYSLARRYGLKDKDLIRANHIRRNRIKTGQVLLIPVSGRVAHSPEGDEPERTASDTPGAEPADMTWAAEVNGCEDLVSLAERFKGTPYRFGGNGAGGFDCSGFSRKVFGSAGIELPRTAREQFQTGSPVDKDDLRRGDLVFFQTYARFASHVGIYMGDGKFIHASSHGNGIEVSTLDEPYYLRRYLGARRIEKDTAETAEAPDSVQESGT